MTNIPMTKKQKYQSLVAKRKADKSMAKHGYINQSDFPEFDSNEIGNYSMWANDLDADLMVVAQDYCDIDSFPRCEGLVQNKPFKNPENIKEWETKTNYYLWKLLKSIGRDIGLPHNPKKAGVFLTNAIVDLKPGNMTAKLHRKVSDYSGVTYLKPLIDIVEPKKIVALGREATASLLRLYSTRENGFSNKANQSFKQVFREGEFTIRNGETTVYPMYHPGLQGQSGRGQIEENKDKSGFELMVEDWERIRL
jgi:hypothetical protein